MKRPLRWAFNLVTLLSLLLSVVTVMVWSSTPTYNYRTRDETQIWDTGAYRYGWYGSVYLHRAQMPTEQCSFGSVANPLAGYRHWVSDAWFNEAYEYKLNVWLVVSILLALPALWMLDDRRQRLRRQRLRNHLCVSCGYDLRATPGRCPECGTVPSARSAG